MAMDLEKMEKKGDGKTGPDCKVADKGSEIAEQM
jgi:hypothetical protein